MFWAVIKLLQRSGAKVQILLLIWTRKGHRAIIFIYLGRKLFKPNRNPKEISSPVHPLIIQARLKTCMDSDLLAQPKPKEINLNPFPKPNQKLTLGPTEKKKKHITPFWIPFFPSFLSPLPSHCLFLFSHVIGRVIKWLSRITRFRIIAHS